MLSNSRRPYPLKKQFRGFRENKKKILLGPKLIKLYNEAVGGADLVNAAVATYRIKIKGKKWWWLHFSNTLRIFMGAAWRIYNIPTPMRMLLSFILLFCSSH